MEKRITGNLAFLSSVIIVILIFLPDAFDAYQTPKFFVVFCFSAFILGLFFFRKDQLVIPIFESKNTKFFVSGILFILIAVVTRHFSSFSITFALYTASFFIIALLAFKFEKSGQEEWRKQLLFALQLSVVPIITIGLLHLAGDFFLLSINEFRPSVMGHQNFTAEALGIGVIALIFGNPRLFSTGAHWFLVAASFLYLCVLTCRAVIASILLVSFIYFVGKLKPHWRIITAACCGTILFSLISFSTPFFQQWVPWSSKTKNNTVEARIARWGNTVELIKDNVMFGIGPNNYQFSYLPYSRFFINDNEVTDSKIVFSPHNIFLEIASALGLPFLCLCLIAGIIFWRNRRTLHGQNERSFERFTSAFLLYFLIVGFFAFPWRNPFVLLATAIITGTYLGIQTVRTYSKPALRILSGLAFGFFVLGFSVWTYAHYVEAYQIENDQHLERACRIFPEHWENCVQLVIRKLNKGDTSEASIITSKLLQRNPLNFPALALQSEIAFKENRDDEACEILDLYRDLFGENASYEFVAAADLEYCATKN